MSVSEKQQPMKTVFVTTDFKKITAENNVFIVSVNV